MSTKRDPGPPLNTFIVRFWQEWSAAGSRWRGRIEHVQSREGAAFLDLDEILDFVRRVGVMGGGESRHTETTAREEKRQQNTNPNNCDCLHQR